jgi:phosphatidylethanolamine-binding protein
MRSLTLQALSLLLLTSTHAIPVDQEVLKPIHLWHSESKDVYDVRKALQAAEIIPTVIPDFQPTSLLAADWAPGVSASLGNKLPTLILKLAPALTLTHSPSSLTTEDAALQSCLHARNMTYVVVLTDPDAPSRGDPKNAEYAHWIAAGVPSTSTSEPASGCTRLELAHLHEVLEYAPPTPPKGTGQHRYVFMAFAPANGTTDRLNLSPPKDRKRWGAESDGSRGSWNWAQFNGLIPVGEFLFHLVGN